MDELDGTPIVEVSMGSDYREMMEAMGGQVIPLGRGEGPIDSLAGPRFPSRKIDWERGRDA
ncbi:hypothetical protein [Dietzia kunjamensis]|uniref:hypothetical protein n=1 Tax=Dietzia kunjamensis TaxID=322509 RepID=UPI00336981C2